MQWKKWLKTARQNSLLTVYLFSSQMLFVLDVFLVITNVVKIVIEPKHFIKSWATSPKRLYAQLLKPTIEAYIVPG